MSMTNKLGRMVTYYEELLSVKSQDPLITRQVKYVISPLPQWLWSPNLTGWLHTIRSFFS